MIKKYNISKDEIRDVCEKMFNLLCKEIKVIFDKKVEEGFDVDEFIFEAECGLNICRTLFMGCMRASKPYLSEDQLETVIKDLIDAINRD